MLPSVKFDRPPVVEVVFSVAYSLSQPLMSAHFGLFWQRIRDEYPRIEDNPPIASPPNPQIEGTIIAQFDFLQLPPLRRVWFLDNEGRGIIQIQEDRFIFNWKRNQTDIGYPGYDEVHQRFEKHFKMFIDFLTEENLQITSTSLLELVYVNDIDQSNGLLSTPDNLTSLFVDHRRDQTRDRFLPHAASFNWGTTYKLPDGYGSLSIIAQAPADPGRGGSIRLNMVARGLPKDLTESSRLSWFELAHEWVTKGFADVIEQNIQTEGWGRTT